MGKIPRKQLRLQQTMEHYINYNTTDQIFTIQLISFIMIKIGKVSTKPHSHLIQPPNMATQQTDKWE